MKRHARALVIAALTAASVVASSGAAGAAEASPASIVTCTPSVAAFVTAPGSDSVGVYAAGDSSLLCRLFSVDVGVTDVTAGQGLYSGSMGATASFQATFTVPRGHTLVISAQQHYTSVQDSATPTIVAPSQVSSLIASDATTTSIQLDWIAPANDGGSAVTGYLVSWADVQAPTPTTEIVLTGLLPATTYTFAVSAVNAAGSSDPVVVTAATAARPVPPGPGPAPSPQPGPITPVTVPVSGVGNVDGSIDTDSAPRTIQQTMPGTWPKRTALVSGVRLTLGRLVDMRTSAGQQAVMSVTYLSPSVRDASVTIDGRGRIVSVTATLRKGTRSGAIVLTVSASAMSVADVGYEGIQASRRFTVRPE